MASHAMMLPSVMAIALVVSACQAARPTDGAAEAIASHRATIGWSLPSRARSEPPRDTSIAQTRASVLSVDASVALAKKRSARLRELEARVIAAESAVDAAGAFRNPELRVARVLADRIEDGKPRVVPLVRLSPDRPGEIASRQDEARSVAAAARAALREGEVSLETEVRRLFEEVVTLDAEIAAFEAIAAARRQRQTQAKDRITTGTMTALDTDVAELLAIEASEGAAERRARRAAAFGLLCDWVGIAMSDEPRLSGDAADEWPPAALPPESVLVERALAESARIRDSAAGIDGAEARLRRERGRRWPWFSFVELGYTFAPDVSPGLGWSLGAGVDVPVWSLGGAGVRRAEAEKDASRRALEAEVERVTMDVRARVREVEVAATRVSNLRRDALPAIARAKEDAERALQAGNVDPLRVAILDEHRAGLELRLLDATHRYRAAVAELRRSISGPPLP